MTVFFDSGSATKPDDNLLENYYNLQKSFWANPNSYHNLGRAVFDLSFQSQETVAKVLNCSGEQILFGPSVSFLNQQILQKIAKENISSHFIISEIDHSSIQKTCKDLENRNLINLSKIPVQENGKTDLEKLFEFIKPETKIISFPFISTETGVLQDYENFLKRLKIVNQKRQENDLDKILIYVDGASLPRFLDISLVAPEIDFLLVSGSKIYALPSALAFVRDQKWLKNFQNSLLFGRQDVCKQATLAKALHNSQQNLVGEKQNSLKLKDYLISKIQQKPNLKFLELADQLPNYILLEVDNFSEEVVFTKLDLAQIYVSLGAVCVSGGIKKAVFLEKYFKNKTVVRLVLDKNNTQEDLDEFLELF